MESFWQFMNSTGFASFISIGAFGAFVGFLSWKSGRESAKINEAGNKRLEQSIEEGNLRLEKSIEEGNIRLEKLIEESRKTMESNQLRWDQADEFNKRLLERILDRVS